MNTHNESPTQASKPGFPIGWIIAVLLVIVAWAGAYALRGSGEKEVIAGWADGMVAGQALAEQADKPMVVLFTAGWCSPCQVMKKKVLADPEVEALLQSAFVPVQIDLTDQSPSNPNVEVAQRYGVRGVPTVMVMSPGGKSIEMYRGDYDDPAAFQAWVTRLAE